MDNLPGKIREYTLKALFMDIRKGLVIKHVLIHYTICSQMINDEIDKLYLI